MVLVPPFPPLQDSPGFFAPQVIFPASSLLSSFFPPLRPYQCIQPPPSRSVWSFTVRPSEVLESNITIYLNNTQCTKYHTKYTLSWVSISKLFILYVWKIRYRNPPKFMQLCIPTYYLPRRNRRPNLLWKLSFYSIHIPFVLNNPPISLIIWWIHNIINPHKTFCAIGWLRYPYDYFISVILF